MSKEHGFLLTFIAGLSGAVIGGVIATIVTYIPDWLTNEPPRVELKVSPTEGPAPLDVVADAITHDPDGDAPLRLFWSVDGVPDGEGELTNHTFSLPEPGNYRLAVRVVDRHKASSDERVQIVAVTGRTGPTTVSESTEDTQDDQLDRPPFPERVATDVVEAIKAGEYEEVDVSEFIGTVIATRQIEKDVLKGSINDALTLLSSNRRTEYKHVDRWDVTITGGNLFIFRTRDSAEFLRALEGVEEVLEAIRQGQDVDEVKILIRGTEKFYDINGIRGLGTRAWIGLDLR